MHTIVQDDIVKWLEKAVWGEKFHAVLSDPPYGLAFMGKKWDTMTAAEYQAWVTEWATLMLDVVYPGAVLMMFGGTRTYHRLVCGLEDAGWEIYDSLMYVYGSGFPKSHDISKAIDREAGAEREVMGERVTGNAKQRTNGSGEFGGWANSNTSGQQMIPITTPATPDAQRWQGYGTALKPAFEPIVLARAPRTDTYAKQALTYGTGALNIDGCRIAHNEPCNLMKAQTNKEVMTGSGKIQQGGRHQDVLELKPEGRWPANVILDEHAAAALDAQSGESGGGNFTQVQRERNKGWGNSSPGPGVVAIDNYGDAGGASRFFKTVNSSPAPTRFSYHSKASSWERSAGLDGKNTHPTVKPIKLTTYLATMLLPPKLEEPRKLLVPFSGSGSEMIGGHLAGWDQITGIELDDEYIPLSQQRVGWWSQFSSYEEAEKSRSK